MIKRSYFVYLHRRNDTGEVFYVGKGTRTQKHQYDRSIDKSSRNQHWKRIVAKHGYTIEVVADFFAEEDAFNLERELIASYGKALCNLTAGGDGCSGINPSSETRKKLSVLASLPRSDAWIASIRVARKNGGNGGVVKAGDKLPESWRKSIAATKVGSLNPMHGKTGAKHPMSRPVIHIQSGVFCDSVEDAAIVFGYKMKTLYNWLSGHRHNPTNLKFA